MTKLYPSAVGVAYTPATIRGAWEKTTGHAVCGMGNAKDLSGLGGPLSINSVETVNTTDYDVLLLRCVSAPLAANCNFSGTLNVMMAVQESNTDADLAYYVHVFVTQGDTDNLRGTLPLVALAGSGMLFRLIQKMANDRAAAWAVVILNLLPAFNLF